MSPQDTSIAIIGAGITGIAAAYFLMKNHGLHDVVLIDEGAPMAFTSAQSGDNYRNWWPSRLMMDFTNRSIDLMEAIAAETGNRIAMTRRGYLLATRLGGMDQALHQLQHCLGGDAEGQIRIHGRGSRSYAPHQGDDWRDAPGGFDLVRDPALIRAGFPSLDPAVTAVLHLRRGGDISGQQLGQVMQERLQAAGMRRVNGKVVGIDAGSGFVIDVQTREGLTQLRAARIVNAAGPFAAEIAHMLDVDLPLYNVIQQKIAFPDPAAAIPRDLPFVIDTDRQTIDWTAEEREVLAADHATAHLAAEMPGAIHCRPEGGLRGNWVKLGWAYNEVPQPASRDIPLDPRFPEIVLRGAARLNPALKTYYGKLPRQMHHYGGWYTRTADNWPLIGPMGPEGAFMACGLSGHGTMAACATGELLAATMAGAPLPAWGRAFSLARLQDADLARSAGTDAGLL